MSTLESNLPEEDSNLSARELVYVSGLILVGVVFATLILSGAMF
jgi:hypothetical protein